MGKENSLFTVPCESSSLSCNRGLGLVSYGLCKRSPAAKRQVTTGWRLLPGLGPRAGDCFLVCCLSLPLSCWASTFRSRLSTSSYRLMPRFPFPSVMICSLAPVGALSPIQQQGNSYAHDHLLDLGFNTFSLPFGRLCPFVGWLLAALRSLVGTVTRQP